MEELFFIFLSKFHLFFPFVLFFFFLFKSIFLVKQAESIIIERLGKYHRTLHSGLNFIIPFIDSPRETTWTMVFKDQISKKSIYINNSFYLIDLRENVYEFPKQHVITKDNVSIEIDSILYYQIFDSYRAIYCVSNLTQAIEKLTQTTLRNIIGSMDLDSTLSSRDFINEKLRIILDEAADKWGVHINRVELQDVNPPKEIQHAMEKQMRAERDRRAIILEFEGKKQAAILDAEGEKQSAILKAKGLAESIFIKAEAEAKSKVEIAKAEAESIELIKKCFDKKDLSMKYLIAEKYIQSFSELSKGDKTKTIIIPYENSTLLSSISYIKELFEENKK